MNQEEESAILKEAKARYDTATGAWSEHFEISKKVLNFVDGDQWDHQDRNAREAAKLPCLEINVLKPFLRQITNEARQNVPSIQVDPRGDGTDQTNAETISDLIRAIEQQSNASTAYDQAGWYAAACGLGFIRVISDYESEDSFCQKLIIKHVEDPSTVLMDPSHKNLDGSDAEWCFVTSAISIDEYHHRYGSSRKSQKIKDDPKGWTDINRSTWTQADQVIVAEYFWKEYKDAVLYEYLHVATGKTFVTKEKIEPEDLEAQGVIELRKRPIQEVKVRWVKLNDEEVLEETEWPGKSIPVVAVKGDETWINGKRSIKGAIEDAIDSQRSLNYFQSLAAELVALAPKAPFIGEARQFAGFEQEWSNSNNAPYSHLRYNAVVVNGQVLSPPARQTMEVPIQAASQLVGSAKDNLKSIFGIFDASLGNAGNEISGKAILARQQQSHTTTYHFYDNLVNAIEQIGRILVEAIPVYYGDERSVQLLKRNGESSTLKVNNGNDEHDLTIGNYGVVVETGPSYATKRQEAVNSMVTLGEVYPQAMPLIADLIAGESDWPGAKQVADRLRLMLPPQIQQSESAVGNLTPKQQAQMSIQQVQQLTQQLQQAQQLIQVGHQHIQNLEEENKLLKTKTQIEYEKLNSDNTLKTQQLHLSKYTTDLEFKVKMEELKMQREELEIAKAKLAIDATEAMHQVAEDAMERADKHHDKMTQMEIAMPLPADDNGTNLDGQTLK